MTKVEQIPDSVLQAARLRMKRRVASAIVRAMAETGISFEMMDMRLGKKPGRSKQFVVQLIDGEGEALDTFSDLCTAMDCEVTFTLTHLPALSEDKEQG